MVLLRRVVNPVNALGESPTANAAPATHSEKGELLAHISDKAGESLNVVLSMPKRINCFR